MCKVLFSSLKVSALRLASNSPLAILLQQFFFLQQFFSLTKAKSPKAKPSKQKAWGPPSVSLLYPVVNRVEQQFSQRDMTL
jgi:hypothetical protein